MVTRIAVRNDLYYQDRKPEEEQDVDVATLMQHKFEHEPNHQY